jgi:hypothetical protein
MIILWHDQYVYCAALCALSPPAFRFGVRPIFVELRSKTRNFRFKIGLISHHVYNIGQIENVTAGGERAHRTSQSAYWLCHDTICTQILNWNHIWGNVGETMKSNCDVIISLPKTPRFMSGLGNNPALSTKFVFLGGSWPGLGSMVQFQPRRNLELLLTLVIHSVVDIDWFQM